MYTVYRQDDNGNRFVMQAGLSLEEAERIVRTFEARGHKQLYWVEAEGALETSDRPSMADSDEPIP